VSKEHVTMADGFFTVQLDFGDVFTGEALWLEIALRPGESVEPYTTLVPRQPLTASPYALHARTAENSLGALSCTTNQIARFDGQNWVCATDQSAALQTQLDALTAQVSALESLLSGVSRSGNDILIRGANLRVVN